MYKKERESETHQHHVISLYREFRMMKKKDSVSRLRFRREFPTVQLAGYICELVGAIERFNGTPPQGTPRVLRPCTTRNVMSSWKGMVPKERIDVPAA